jgi:transcriptional regulator with XRE-family HTH domain
MIKGAELQGEYYGGQAVEVRNTHNGFDRWRPAKIHRRTSRGCEVVYTDGTDRRPQHIMLSDLRPTEKTEREHTPKIKTPLLSDADIDRINAQIEEKQRAEAAKAAAPQTLVLVKRPPQDSAPPPAPALRLTPSGRRARMPRAHTPSPLSTLLRNARAAKRLQQNEVRQLSGVKRMSEIELGDLTPTDDECINLAIALDLDVDELLKLRDTPATDDAPPAVAEMPAPKPEATPAPKLEAAPAPPPEVAQSLSASLLEARHELSELRRENSSLRQARPASADTDRLLHELTQARSDNAALRRIVVFYAEQAR